MQHRIRARAIPMRLQTSKKEIEQMKSYTIDSKTYQLHKHPWLSMLAIMFTTIISIIISSKLLFGILGISPNSKISNLTQPMLFHILTGFIIAPLILHLPKGKTTYRQYLRDIGLSGEQEVIKLVLLGVSCYFFLAISQASASIIYRFFEGNPITLSFIQGVITISEDASSLLATIPSMFEEVGSRGIVLTVFLNSYSERKSIIFSSIGFSLMHLLNLAMGRELVWVIGQLIWSFTIGLFYGYVFVMTRSLLPPMIVHYLSNAFIGSLTGYMQSSASTRIEALYGVILTLGIVPTVLMILWARYFISEWLDIKDDSKLSKRSSTSIELRQEKRQP
jgi:membrane protease YdiL (CAAX protease family)